MKTDVTHDRVLYRDIIISEIPIVLQKHSVLRCVFSLYALKVVSIGCIWSDRLGWVEISTWSTGLAYKSATEDRGGSRHF